MDRSIWCGVQIAIRSSAPTVNFPGCRPGVVGLSPEKFRVRAKCLLQVVPLLMMNRWMSEEWKVNR
jgi:hypothetical protein